MPTAPLVKCLERDCKLRVARGYCATRARPAWGKPEHKPKRIRGRALQKKRRHLFAHEPLCRLCRRESASTVITSCLSQRRPR